MMDKAWEKDKKWSDRFLPEIKRILGECLIREAPIEEDMEHNTDLIVLKLDGLRVACRVRRFDYFNRYPDDITIRSDRASGNVTELAKIITESWGDYFFYGFSDKDGITLCKWKLISLNVFRKWFLSECVNKKEVPGVEQVNYDGGSKFRVFDTRKMPSTIIFKQF